MTGRSGQAMPPESWRPGNPAPELDGVTDGFMNTIGFGKHRPAPLRDVEDERLVELLIAFALM